MAGPAAPTAPGDTVQPLKGSALWIAGAILSLSNFMAVLDMAITNVAVPHVAGSLAVSPSESTWVITSYAVAEAIIVPLTGWLTQRFGTVRVFTTSIVCFTIASAFCGLSSSLEMLVAFRILQGLSAGPLMPLSQTLLQRIVEPKHMPTAISVWMVTTLVGPVAGPLVGGMIVDTLGWQWCFFVNIPIGIALGFFALQTLPSVETKTKKLPVDYVGLVLLVTWVGAVQIMIDTGRENDWLASDFIKALLAISIIGFFTFLIWELTAENPIVNLRIFRHAGFSMACVAMALCFGLMFTAAVLVPLWLQTDMGYTAGWAGSVIAFQGLLGMTAAPIVGRLLSRYDARYLLMFGLVGVTVSFLYRTTFTSQVDFWHLVVPNMMMGFSIPFFFLPMMTLAMGSVEPHETAGAAGLLAFVRTMAGATAVALLTTNWQNEIELMRGRLVGEVNDQSGVLRQLQAQGMSYDAALHQLEGMIQHQSVMLATNAIFATLALVMASCVVLILLLPRAKHGMNARR